MTPQHTGPIARRLEALRQQGRLVARDERTPTMRPGPPPPTRLAPIRRTK